MTVVNPAAFLQNAGATHTAQNSRMLTSGLLGAYQSAGSLMALGGVNPHLGGRMAVAQNGTPNMSVNVSSGHIFIPGTQDVKQGVYSCTNDGTVNLVIGTSDPTNPRIDTVYAFVQDQFYAGSNNLWGIAVQAGTPAASPSAPSLPASQSNFAIADVRVNAGVTTILTANITDRRSPFASGLGGKIITTVATLSGVLAPGGNLEGLTVYCTDDDSIRYCDGASWIIFNRFPKLLLTTSASGSVGTGASPVTITADSTAKVQTDFPGFTTPWQTFTIPRTGTYRFTSQQAFGSNATGERRLHLILTGTSAGTWTDNRPAVSGDNTHCTATWEFLCSAGDTATFKLDQNSGATLSLTNGRIAICYVP
jgi:hypothetical protein